MEPVTVALSVLAGLAVFAIAAAVVGREAHRLDSVAPRVVYRLDEAVDFVADHLPEPTQARLTPAELEQLLVLHLRWLHGKGLQPVDVVDLPQSITAPTVITEDTLIGYILGAAESEGVELLDDVDAVAVVEAHLEYLDAIGAVGPPADEPDDLR